jgi:predicted CoA-binding protein
MKPTDEFFSGTRYAIFGATARGRMQGNLVIAALKKVGKTPIAIDPDGGAVKGAEIVRSLEDAGSIDGAILLPPSPWNETSVAFTTDATRQCKERGISHVWIYTVKDPAPAVAIAEQAGLDPVAGRCPCLHIPGGGFPHNIHRTLARWTKKL